MTASDIPLKNIENLSERARPPVVEAQISRIKRCIGSRLLTRRFESQQREGVIIANLVNPWNSFGKSVCVKTA